MAANNFYVNERLDIRPTEELITNLLELSLSSLFSVEIKDYSANEFTQAYISLLAYEAVLPGTSFQTGQIFGDRQGISETYANQRVYPPIDVSFYIKADYGTISYFENWMSDISPLSTTDSRLATSYYKFNYPSEYKKTISIVKYERDGRPKGYENRLKPRGTSGKLVNPNSITYTLINAYPTNIISIPVSYDRSDILRTTITFNYDRYVLQRHVGNTNESLPKTT